MLKGILQANVKTKQTNRKLNNHISSCEYIKLSDKCKYIIKVRFSNIVLVVHNSHPTLV